MELLSSIMCVIGFTMIGWALPLMAPRPALNGTQVFFAIGFALVSTSFVL